jgi:hypothetical protein
MRDTGSTSGTSIGVREEPDVATDIGQPLRFSKVRG